MAVPDEASVDPRPAMKKSAWTKKEDAVLEEQVRLHGPRNWEGISAALPGRNAKSCRLRWCQHLAPEVDAVRPFTPREDATIVALQKVHPNKWATIAGYLPGRTDNAIKNRWNSVLRKQQHKDRTLPLFRLVPGDIRTAPSVDYTAAAIDHEMPAAEGGGDRPRDAGRGGRRRRRVPQPVPAGPWGYRQRRSERRRADECGLRRGRSAHPAEALHVAAQREGEGEGEAPAGTQGAVPVHGGGGVPGDGAGRSGAVDSYCSLALILVALL